MTHYMNLQEAKDLMQSTIQQIKHSGFEVTYEDQLGIQVVEPKPGITVDASNGKAVIRSKNGKIIGCQG
jgi:hypothetical protein